jgi:hypothetical protein
MNMLIDIKQPHLFKVSQQFGAELKRMGGLSSVSRMIEMVANQSGIVIICMAMKQLPQIFTRTNAIRPTPKPDGEYENGRLYWR